MNQYACIGRLGVDPTLHETNAGTKLCRLRVAVPRAPREGREVQPLWLSVTVFGRQADACVRHLRKGSQVGITGRLEPDEWTARNGATNRSVQVVASDVRFLTPTADRSEEGEEPTPPPVFRANQRDRTAA